MSFYIPADKSMASMLPKTGKFVVRVLVAEMECLRGARIYSTSKEPNSQL